MTHRFQIDLTDEQVKRIATTPLDSECFGHGSYGYKCRYCGATDYYCKSLQHEPFCLVPLCQGVLAAPTPPAPAEKPKEV